MHMYIYMCVYPKIYIPKYNLLGMYDVKCIDAFTSGLLALENHFVFSSLGKTTSPTTSFLQMPDYLCRVEAF